MLAVRVVKDTPRTHTNRIIHILYDRMLVLLPIVVVPVSVADFLSDRTEIRGKRDISIRFK